MKKQNLKNKLEDDVLDLSFMEIVTVPVKDIAEVKKARSLDLSVNFIEKLPASFTILTQITILDLSRNKLKELPEDFGKMKQLTRLDLYENQLRKLPISMGQLLNLKWLDLKNNPLEPRLLQVAGDCLDDKQCQVCAKRTVAYCQSVSSQLEREQQLRLEKLREKEEAMKAAEEREKERIRQEKRNEKRAIKERRRQELKIQERKRNLESEQAEFSDVDSTVNGNAITTQPVRTSKNVESEAPSRCWRMLKWLLLLLLVAAAAGAVGIMAYTGDLSMTSFNRELTRLQKKIHKMELVSTTVEHLKEAWEITFEVVSTSTADFVQYVHRHGPKHFKDFWVNMFQATRSVATTFESGFHRFFSQTVELFSDVARQINRDVLPVVSKTINDWTSRVWEQMVS